MTTTFYVPRALISDARVHLPEDEAIHAARVLRLRRGDAISVVDGEGGWFHVRVDHADHRQVAGHIVEQRREVGEPPYELTLAVGIIKQRARFETFLEKAVELGVSEVVPLITARTEKEKIRHERLESKLIAAMKQCGRSRLVRLREPVALREFVTSAEKELALCCHEKATEDEHLMGVLRRYQKPVPTSILVGPEGGFTDQEIRWAEEHRWRIVSLGRRRLRTETAAMAAAAAVAFAWDGPGSEHPG